MVDEKIIRKIMSGEDRSKKAACVRALTGALSLAYRTVVANKNKSFDAGKNIEHAQVPVLSIGNITAGGTGKTPFAAYICHQFLSHGIFPTVLMRGYKAKNNDKPLIVSSGENIAVKQEDAGDEAYLLAHSIHGAGVVIAKSRVEGAKIAVNSLGAEVIILDDGFQHRKLHRDVNMVLIDATNPFGYDYVLPRGLLREPLEGLKRADIFILTKVDQVDLKTIEKIKSRLRQYNDHAPIVETIHAPQGVRTLEEWVEGKSRNHSVLDQKWLAVSAIGNPESFKKTLETSQCHVIDSYVFMDHHAYTMEDVTAIEKRALEKGATAIVITEKDAVKLEPLIQQHRNLWHVLPISINVTNNEDALLQLISTVIEKIKETK